MPKSFQDVADRQKLLLDMAQALPYKQIDGADDLVIHFYLPKNLKEGALRPVMLFFHSGAFDRGNEIQFAPHALHFLERGAVCGLVRYRMKASHPDSNPIQAVQDGISAVRFVRRYAEKFHIDPAKIVAIGAGAGGTIAGCAAMRASIPDDLKYERNPDLSGVPDAAVLLSSFVTFAKGRYGADAFEDPGEMRRLSLLKNIRGNCAPMLLIHGTSDRLIPFEDVENFALKMQRKKNVLEFFPFEGRDSNYYNLNVDPVSYEACLECIDTFLTQRELLPEKKEGAEDVRVISWREEDY